MKRNFKDSFQVGINVITFITCTKLEYLYTYIKTGVIKI